MSSTSTSGHASSWVSRARCGPGRIDALAATAAVALILILIYLLFRVVPAPGATSPEEIDGVGLVVQGVQVAVVVAAAVALRSNRKRVAA